MQQGRCQYETGCISEFSGTADFTAMSMSMKQAEQADNGRARQHRKSRRQGNKRPERDNGNQDHRFDKRQMEAGEGKRKSGDHGADEGGGQTPDGLAAEQGGPKADGNHGQYVIQSEHRMAKSGGE